MGGPFKSYCFPVSWPGVSQKPVDREILVTERRKQRLDNRAEEESHFPGYGHWHSPQCL